MRINRFALAFVPLFGLAACGGQAETEEGTEETEVVEPAPAPAPAPAPMDTTGGMMMDTGAARPDTTRPR